MNKAIILAGGQGKRMNSDMPKPLLKVLGEPMLEWVISACQSAGVSEICIVKGFKGEMIDEYLGGRYPSVLQSKRLGTGHAVMQAVPFLEDDPAGNTLVLCGDAPFVDEATIREALALHEEQGNAITVITSELEEPFGYGRIIRNPDGSVNCIVEQKDANEQQQAVKEVNSGTYWFRTADLIDALSKLTNANAQNEYYLTDTLAIAVLDGKKAGAYKSSNPDIIKGANDRRELLEFNNYARMKVIEKHMLGGVEFTCLDGIIIERGVEIGRGTEILPGTILRGNTKIGEGCKIGPNTIIENSVIGDLCTINTAQIYDSEIEAEVNVGPFVHIRPDCHVGSNSKVGDFVELKNSNIGEKTAIAHLAYIGDSDIGRKVNIGCGTVTVNYDGITKNRCVIGDNSFIGCNTNLIAPVQLGKAVYTAAGTTVTRDIPDYALAIERGVMKINEGYTIRKLKTKQGK